MWALPLRQIGILKPSNEAIKFVLGPFIAYPYSQVIVTISKYEVACLKFILREDP